MSLNRKRGLSFLSSFRFLSAIKYNVNDHNKGSSGGSRECSSPPLRQNGFIFMENVPKIRKNNKYSGKFTNRTPLCKFEPLVKNSWIRPWVVCFYHLLKCFRSIFRIPLDPDLIRGSIVSAFVQISYQPPFPCRYFSFMRS